MASLFTFENVYRAYLDCRRKKRGKQAALAFEVNAEQYLLQLTRELEDRTYHPFPSFCFVAKNDKHREVFAADFRDRVVHHLLVRRLEKIWEPVFIYDSYACRKGKGTHGAVERLRSFTHKVTANQTRRAWFAQLDIRAFFPSIDRNILLSMVLSRLQNEELRWLSELLILHDSTIDPVFTCSPEKWKNVPTQKSLFSVPSGKGLPIGNLTSQFFANVYLNSLDQFVKHSLKVRWYMRYVDDLVLLDLDRHTLQDWTEEIGTFLKNTLKLDLHPNRRIIRPVSNGIDFVGYIVRPSHLYIRKRVVEKCKTAITDQTKGMMKRRNDCVSMVFMPGACHKLYCTLNSYFGAFSHASCHRLVQTIFTKNLPLRTMFKNKEFKVIKRWSPPFRSANLYTQYRFFRARFRGLLLFQVGCYLEMYDKDALWAVKHLGMKRIFPRKGFYARCGISMKRLKAFSKKLAGQHAMYVFQTGRMHGRILERVAVRMDYCDKSMKKANNQ